jgi:23S rRNA (adenine2030-N6)-methyltransferase
VLSYRHAFHAGNHADVLKHLVLVQMARHLGAEGQGLLVHRYARRGRQLRARFAMRPSSPSIGTASAASGCARICRRPSLTTSIWCALANPDGRLKIYPGSPTFAL